MTQDEWGEPAGSQLACWYIKHGVAPSALEKYAKSEAWQAAAIRYQIAKEDLIRLAKRWGII